MAIEAKSNTVKGKRQKIKYTNEFYLKYKKSIQSAQRRYRDKNLTDLNQKALDAYRNLTPEKKLRRLEQMRLYNKKRKFKRIFSKKVLKELQLKTPII